MRVREGADLRPGGCQGDVRGGDVINRGAGRGNQITLFSDVAASGARSGEIREERSA